MGIDLGTTVSVLSVRDATGRIELAKTRDGGFGLRSAVLLSADGDMLLGEHAVRAAPMDPDRFFELFKRSMGEDTSYDVDGRSWAPEDLSAELLKALASDAEGSLGWRPSRAVITIPAYFGDDARRATRRAAELAGLEPIALLHEPTAACLAYEPAEAGERTVLVYDLGGGTFDVSVVRVRDSAAEVLATVGDHRLGGRDWDVAMAELLTERIQGTGGEDPLDDPVLAAELMERARETKHALSGLPSARVNVPTASGVERVEVSAADYGERSAALFMRTAELVRVTVEEIGGAGAIDEALLVGGSSRMPRCREVVEEITGHPPSSGIDPDRAVAIGAAIVASGAEGPVSGASGSVAAISGSFTDVTAHALGFVVVSADGSRYVNEVMIERNARIPAARTKKLRLDGGGSDGSLEVHMLQGEAERPLETSPLGLWRFEGIPAGKTGREVEVTYQYDGDGVAVVNAAIDGEQLPDPIIARNHRDLSWTHDDPSDRAAPAETGVALVIDVSGSMSGAKLEEAKNALLGFVDVFEDTGFGGRIALIIFGSQARCLARYGDSPKSIRKAIRGVQVEGSTNMAAGLAEASRQLPQDLGRRVIVLLTDGQPDDQSATLRERKALVGDQVAIMARGVSGADEVFLRRLDTEGGQMVDLSELAGLFRGIARQIAQGASLGTRA